MATITAVTTARVNLRSGPGTQHGIRLTLPARANLVVLAREGDWLQVEAGDLDGFVHRGFVQLSSEGVPEGFLKDKLEPAKPATPAVPASPATPATPADTPPSPAEPAGPDLANVPLEPPATQKLRVNPKDPLLNRLAASIWNRFGHLLSVLSADLKIEPAVAVAVFAVESGGNCFGPDGRMIIRFENQVFFDQWGRKNAERFHQHFAFNPNQRWLDHKWRPSPNEPWRPADLPNFHGNQSREWEVLNFARTLDDTAAKLSISMGAPQIMGFNYATCGYESVHEMFAAFAASERNQIIGFFDFVQGPGNTSRTIVALQQQDFNAFAARYNGPGQAAKYGGLIRTTYDAFQQMRAAAGV